MSKLKFDSEQHRYYLINNNGEIETELISVSKLMEKHGLKVDYSQVPEQVLAQAALFGNINHAYLEKYFKGLALKEELPETIINGLNILKENKFVELSSEQQVYNDFVAGTIDLIAYHDTKLALVDFKFTYNYNSYAIMWQLNIYKHLAKSSLNIDVEELWCLWYNKQKQEFELKEVPILQDYLVYQLFNAELDGTIFVDQQNTIMKKIETQLSVDRELSKFFEAQEFVKKLEQTVELIKEELLKEMETYGLRAYETDNFKITYVPESTSTTLDIERIKKDYKDVIDFNEYQKTSKRKPYLKIVGKEKKI